VRGAGRLPPSTGKPGLSPADTVRSWVVAALNDAFHTERFVNERYSTPLGDPGLFGPGSVTWRVHADPSMFVGGLSALMLQALHPLVLAGVLDHSDFRIDPLRRLSRTASFVECTTFGSTGSALAVIDSVKRIHTRVQGTTATGRTYSATDPDLLRWVHVAEATAFLDAYRRYGSDELSAADADRYFTETANVAELLGSAPAPKTERAVASYLRSMAPQLSVTLDTRETLSFLMKPLGRDAGSRAASRLLSRAAIGTLPRWARELYGVRYPPGFEQYVIRTTTRVLLAGLRWATEPNPVLVAATARTNGRKTL